MNLPFEEETYSVSQLCEEVRDFLAQGFYSVWVAGEVQRLRESRRGHVYFELVEKDGREGIRGKLEAVLWAGDRRRLGRSAEPLAEGVEIRARGNLDFYAPSGRLQFVLRELDPLYTLGLLERQRRATLEALAEAGLLERNAALPFATLPLDVALITSADSAAYHDFLATLDESGYGFRVTLLHASVQGVGAEEELVSALRAAGELAPDCIALVRGGGARSDLAAFDHRAVAEAIARAPVPVLTGLGHEIDVAIADLTAHTALKTPTKAAESLVERVAEADARLLRLEEMIPRAAGERLREQRDRLARAGRAAEVARWRLVRAGDRLAEIGRALERESWSQLRAGGQSLAGFEDRLRRPLPALFERRRQRLEELSRQLLRGARQRLREASSELQGIERLCDHLSPRRTLERGFSITRDSRGRALRSPQEIAAGEPLVTTLAHGEVRSRVEKS
ncbi:MAG: exodeoxyribonuclease VII large subunit [Acidobacteriota bacterium]